MCNSSENQSTRAYVLSSFSILESTLYVFWRWGLCCRENYSKMEFFRCYYKFSYETVRLSLPVNNLYSWENRWKEIKNMKIWLGSAKYRNTTTVHVRRIRCWDDGPLLRSVCTCAVKIEMRSWLHVGKKKTFRSFLLFLILKFNCNISNF